MFLAPQVGRTGYRSAWNESRTNVRDRPDSGHRLLQILVDLVEEALGRQPFLLRTDEKGQILRHVARLDRIDADLLERVRERVERCVVVQLGAMGEPARPGKNRRDGIGRGRLALLILPVVSGDRSVRGLGFHSPSIRRQQDACHQAERAETLSDGVGLHIAIVVLARPDIAATPFERARHHVVDQPVFIGDAELFELGGEFGLEHLLEDVLEAAVIGLENRVLGREIDRPFAHDPIGHRGARELAKGFSEIVHRQRDAWAGRLEDVMLDHRAVVSDELDRQLAFSGKEEIGGAILIAIRMTPDDDRFRPAWDKARHVLADDGLAEDDAAQDVADRSVGRLPHLLELEFRDAGLVGRDGGAFDADADALDRFGGIDGHLVRGRIAMLDPEIVIFQLDVEIGQDQLVANERPDDAGHLVAIEFDDGIGNLDLVHEALGISAGAGYTGATQTGQSSTLFLMYLAVGTCGIDRSRVGRAMSTPVIILSRPQLGENIGAAARAMKNFGLSELRLVAPRSGWPNEKANHMAVGAVDIVKQAKLFGDASSALADLQFVVATTARERGVTKPVLTPPEAVRQLREATAQGTRCGILFGSERAGLDNDEVSLATSVVTIPTTDFSSINLSQSVMLLCYEWFRAGDKTPAARIDHGPVAKKATREEMFQLF